MRQLPAQLRDNVRLLGEILGETLNNHEGTALFELVETLRSLAKDGGSRATGGQNGVNESLVKTLDQLEDKSVLPVVRAFNQFLNLANIADQEYFSSHEAEQGDPLDTLMRSLREDKGKDDLFKLLCELEIGIVLTAHPTEVTRRTLIHKYEGIARVLSDISRTDLLEHEQARLQDRLTRLVEEVWNTTEIRDERPSAVDEAKWGFAVIENSLWRALPRLLRHLDRLSRKRLGRGLPLDIQPFNVYSLMGGDRDGNPNVTSKVTREVILLGRWKAAELYLKDVDALIQDLSMSQASSGFRKTLRNAADKTPYRAALKLIKERLQVTKDWTKECLDSDYDYQPGAIINSKADLLEPLLQIHQSLIDCKLSAVADGPLVSLIRRVQAFGINLCPLDIRQDGERHVSAIAELVDYLELGDYQSWDEQARQEFLLEKLEERRPLVPKRWRPSSDTQEVLDTCEVIAKQPREVLSCYVISMAKQPSDVLAVALLLKEAGMGWKIPIVPLFETLDDLDRAAEVMQRLWSIDWYKRYTKGAQTIMIGYSDSAKDAGKFMATWALFKAQEELVAGAESADIKLTLFHGRGGTVGRGGGPVEKAMASQPPGSVKGRIRVTEQGEMIRYKFGMPRTAFNSLRTYLMATLKATVTPDPAPKPEYRKLIEKMSQASLERYRSVVRGHEAFVPYFRSLTPEQELNTLALGSRPAKRKAGGGVESLRAIPWVFAWMQVRLNLPGWLGTRQALETGIESDKALFDEMIQSWPFFTSFLDLLEMVVGKADLDVSSHYENLLVDASLHEFGEDIRKDLAQLSELLPKLRGNTQLLEDDSLLQLQIEVRKPYIDPLNYLQAELLKRSRRSDSTPDELIQALKVTMAGISAGMRNTG